MYDRFHISQKAKRWNIKLICYCVWQKQQFRSSAQITSKVFSRKKHPECRHWWPAIQLPMDIHKQAVKNKLASRIWKTSRRTKAMKALFTHQHIYKETFIYTNFLLFWIWQPWTFLLTLIVSMQSISWAMQKNANFRKSCQLLLYLEFA